MKRAFCVILLVFSTRLMQAQEKECTIPEVEISYRKGTKSRPKNDSLFSNAWAQNPGNRSGWYLRCNSPTGSSGLSIRGASSAHTEVSWNGIPLANPLMGQSDISLISPIMLQQARIKESGSQENGFSASFGGNLILESSLANLPNQASIGQNIGSFGQSEQWLSLSGHQPEGRLSGKLNAWHSTGNWDYPFRIGRYQSRIIHNSRTVSGLEGNAFIRLSQKQSLESGLWIQQSKREIPGGLMDENPQSTQKDANNRFYLRHQFHSERFSFSQIVGSSLDSLHFQDTKSAIDSRANCKGLFYRAESALKLSETSIRLQVHGSTQLGNSGTGIGPRKLNRFGMGLIPEFQFRKSALSMLPEIRMEAALYPESNRKDMAFLPGLSIRWNPSNHQAMEFSAHSRFRTPGLNDLYWPNAGNPDLLPEKGFTSEFEWRRQLISGRYFRVHSQFTAYYHQISDYILWQPSGIFWKPENVGQVHLAGLKWKLDYRQKLGQNLNLLLQPDLQISRQELIREGPSGLKRAPLPFQPEIQGGSLLQLESKSMTGFLKAFYQGSRRTSLEGNRLLNGYFLLDLGIEWRFKIQSVSAKWFLQANNLSDQSYQFLPGLPMPGRNLLTGFSLQFE